MKQQARTSIKKFCHVIFLMAIISSLTISNVQAKPLAKATDPFAKIAHKNNIILQGSVKTLSAIASIGSNIVNDPGFEASLDDPEIWGQYSQLFGSPLCTIQICGNGSGTAGPHTGSTWAWFGGTTEDEFANVWQYPVLPTSCKMTLQFYFWIGAAGSGSGPDDYFIVTLGGQTVFTAYATNAADYPSYTLISIDITPSGNNTMQELSFLSVTSGQVVNFNLDDISIIDYGCQISGNAGINGANISYDIDGNHEIINSGISGNYSFSVPYSWDGTVTPSYPSNPCYIFTPLERNYVNVITNQTIQDYIPSLVPDSLCVLSITRTSTNPTSASSVDFTVTFTNDVTGVDADGSDFSLTTTGISGASITGVSGSGSVYTVSVNTGSGNGNIRLDVPVSATITDLSTNPLDRLPFTSGETYSVTKSPSFLDVPSNYWAFSWIELLANSGITSGCGNGNYCPSNPVTRAQMAVFLEKGVHGNAFSPSNVSPTFNDTSGHWAEDWIEALKSDAITSGCGNGNYCPEDSVTRAQMAVFLLKAMHGSSYSPPSASPTFGDDSGHWAQNWIEELALEGITSGCGNGNYCPDSPVTRDQMAVFLVKAFGLP